MILWSMLHAKYLAIPGDRRMAGAVIEEVAIVYSPRTSGNNLTTKSSALF
jgi:hypothetical protein